MQNVKKKKKKQNSYVLEPHIIKKQILSIFLDNFCCFKFKKTEKMSSSHDINGTKDT